MKIVILDNYDSFTYNLYQYVGELEGAPLVFRNDRITIQQLTALNPDRIILSPGPGDPTDRQYFGVCRDAILQLGLRTPTLGVCLGHQGIIDAFGGRIIRTAPMHGKTSYVFHDDLGIFRGLPRAFPAMRYHSLVGDPTSIPACLEVVARTSDNIVMGVRHREYPIHGVQFHPESIGTDVGKQLLANFLRSENTATSQP